MNERLAQLLRDLVDVETTLDLLGRDFVQSALLASAMLGLLAGVLGPMIISRQMSFAVHGASELSLTGAAAALLFGFSVGLGAILGSVVAAVLFGLLGLRPRERDSSIGVVFSFGLGLAAFFLWLYPGRTSTAFSLLIGQVVGVDVTGLALLAGVSGVILVVMAVIWRPLLFASTDPDVAAARGVPVRALSTVFSVLVGLAAAQAVQIVGALLVLALLITPAAAAARLTASPGRAVLLSVVFAEVAVLGGIVLSLAPGAPVSAFVTGIAFTIYLVCRVVGGARRSRAGRRVAAPA